MKKISTFKTFNNLPTLEHFDNNDPILVKLRAAQIEFEKKKKRDDASQIERDKYFNELQEEQKRDRRNKEKIYNRQIKLRQLQKDAQEVHREMEANPEIELEGGPIANEYGQMLNKIYKQINSTNEAKLSFKTERPTGRYRSFSSDYHYIKLDGKKIGQIEDDAPHKIRLMVMKNDVITDNNPNCDWKWITLKRDSASIEDAKEFVQRNIDELIKKYQFHYI